MWQTLVQDHDACRRPGVIVSRSRGWRTDLHLACQKRNGITGKPFELRLGTNPVRHAFGRSTQNPKRPSLRRKSSVVAVLDFLVSASQTPLLLQAVSRSGARLSVPMFDPSLALRLSPQALRYETRR